MPVFTYKAMDGQGKEKKGRIEASDQQDAASQLKQMGLFPTSITEGKGKEKGGKSKGGKEGQGGGNKQSGGGGMVLGTPAIKKKRVPQFTRQLATLLDSGLALVRALRTLEKQSKKDPAQKIVIGQLADAVESGTTFSEALAQHPKTFSHLFVNMVRAGEASGDIEAALDRLATFMEKSQRVAGKIKSAMMYPAVVLTIALGITAGLLTFIVPKFAEIFSDMLPDEDLPGLTKFIIGISNFLKERLLLGIGIIAGIVILFKLIRRSKSGSYAIDWLLLKTPPINALVVRSAVSRFAQTLGTLLNSGVSILQALEIVRETAGNAVVSSAVQKVHDSVKEGEGMTQPMEQTGVFPTMVVSMVEVGEETGAISDMLNRISDVYEEQVDNAVESLTSLMEPIMIVFLAVVVGTIVIAMFMPLISLMGSL